MSATTSTDYAGQRPLMFSIAYRMTGSAVEAEDIVQDAYLRMIRDGQVARNADAYATTITTRLAIDHLRSARVRREQYVGEWLPEPLLSVSVPDPADVVDRHETMTVAFLHVLERLSPSERAAFVLREAFGYEYERIGEIIRKSPENCRQLVTRARTRLGDDAPRFTAEPADVSSIVERFFAACEQGDLAGLEAILAEDVRFHGDGGGKIQAVTRPVAGRVQVARFLLGLMRQGVKMGASVRPAYVNGAPGAALLAADGSLYGVLSVHVEDGHIRGLYNILNPDKLTYSAQALSG